MNKTFIFSKEHNYEKLLIFSIIPLVLYGLYKNAYLLVSNNYLSSFDGYKIILYPIISLLITFIFTKVFKKKKREMIYFGIAASLAAPFKMNMIIFFLIFTLFMYLVYIIPNKYKINLVALFIILLVVLCHFLNSSLIFNSMELTDNYKFTLLDLFFGRGASFLFTSSIFYLLISYFILSFVKTYKKNVFLISSFVFILFAIGYMIINKNYTESFKILFNGTTFYSFIFLAPLSDSSPSINIELTIYSVLVGLLSFILVFLFNIYTGSVLSVLILSIIYRIYTIIRQKIFLEK